MVFTVIWSIFNSFWAVFLKQIEIWFLIYTLSKVELSSFFCRIQRFWVTRINKFHRFRDVLRLNSPHLDVNTKWRNRTLRSEWLTKWELLRSKIREKGWSQLFFFQLHQVCFFPPGPRIPKDRQLKSQDLVARGLNLDHISQSTTFAWTRSPTNICYIQLSQDMICIYAQHWNRFHISSVYS